MTKARDIASAAPAPSTVSATEIGYLDGVSSAIQTQIDSKIGSASAISPTLIDAKGDLIVGSAADTAARLAVGTNNHVLTADSAATNGVKWAAAASGSTFVGCSLYKSATQSISTSSATALTFDVENFDSDGFHDNSTNNSRITIPSGKGGKYLLTGSITWAGGSTGVRIPWLYKNGAAFNIMATIPAASNGNDVRSTFAYTIDLVATDYVELFGWQNNGDNRNAGSGQDTTTFAATYLGA